MKKSCSAGAGSGSSDLFHTVNTLGSDSSSSNTALAKLKRKGKDRVKAHISSNKENSHKPLLSLITRGRVSQKVGLYGKGKSSETISRSKQSTLSSVKSCPSQDNVKLRYVSPPLHTRETDHVACHAPSPEEQDQMEISPKGVAVTMKDVSLRILKGLHSSRHFSEDEYRSNLKSELRKIMKQSNPTIFKEIEYCLQDKKRHYSRSDPLLHHHEVPLSPIPEEQQQPQVAQQQYNPPPAPLCVEEELTSIPSQFLTTTSSHDTFCPNFLESTSSPIALFQAGPAHQAAVATDPTFTLFQNQPQQEQFCLSTDIPQRGTDFLDLLDQQSMSVQIQGSVERPRMFPHKLY